MILEYSNGGFNPLSNSELVGTLGCFHNSGTFGILHKLQVWGCLIFPVRIFSSHVIALGILVTWHWILYEDKKIGKWFFD